MSSNRIVLTKCTAHWKFILFFLAPLSVYFIVLWSHMLTVNHGNLVAGHPYVWADWGLHISLASMFAFRPMSQWFSSFPIFAGAKLNYPFVVDLLSGLMMRAGFTLIQSFVLPSILFSIVFLFGLYRFFTTMLHQKGIAIIASYVFIFSGGLGFLFAATPHYFLRTILDSSAINTQLHTSGIEFTNILMGMLIPQRPFLLGLPIGLAILSVLFSLFQTKARKSHLLSAGVIAGLLPIIHTHTFLVVVIFSCWLFVLSLQKIRMWLWYGVPAVVVTLIVYIFFLRSSVQFNHFFSIHLGWLGQGSLSFWMIFWLKNWGVFIFTSLIGTILLVREKLKLGLFVLGWWLLFTIANIIQFQPQTWDNSKLFAWAYLGLCIPTGFVIAKIWTRRPIVYKLMAGALFVVVCFSGFLDVVHLLDFPNKSYVMVSQPNMELGKFVRTNTSVESNFLTSDYVDGAISTIGGRSVLLGYPGWVFNFGIDYSQREQDIKSMYAGSSNTEQLLEKYNVSYVLISPDEAKYMPNQYYFDKHFPLIFIKDDIRLYKVR